MLHKSQPKAKKSTSLLRASPGTGWGEPRSQLAERSGLGNRGNAEPLRPPPRERTGGAVPGVPGQPRVGGHTTGCSRPAPPQELRAPQPPCPVSPALGAPSGQQEPEIRPVRASLPSPSRSRTDSGLVRRASPLLFQLAVYLRRRSQLHWTRRTCRGPVKSGRSPDVTAARSAACPESPDHPGNARGAGRGEGRRHSASPAPSCRAPRGERSAAICEFAF